MAAATSSRWSAVRSGGVLVYWLRRLPDRSGYLAVTPPEGPDMPWRWQHRGPGYDRDADGHATGTTVHAAGVADTAPKARRAADRHIAGLSDPPVTV